MTLWWAAFPDRVLRLLAWGSWWLLCATIAVGAWLAAVDGRRGPSPVDAGDLWFLAVVVSFPFVGILILRQQPRNTIGWLLVGVGVVSAVSNLADDYARLGLVVHPGSVPGAGVAAAFNEGSWAPQIGLMGTFLLLLFPNGRLPSPRWRPVAWLCAVTIVVLPVVIAFSSDRLDQSPVPGTPNPLAGRIPDSVLNVLLAVFLPLFPVCVLACATALVVRFRRSSGFERLQLKWLTAAGASVAALYLLTMASRLVTWTITPSGADGAWFSVLGTTAVLSFVLLPAAIGIAVLRHRLYDIDVVINKALVYGCLTAALLATYVGSVVVLQPLLAPLTGDSDLAVAGSTLAVAALFRPARRWIQAVVDRRFYRRRYDAARTLDRFATRLRHEVDLDAVSTDLRRTVDDTVQPAHVSLWLRS